MGLGDGSFALLWLGSLEFSMDLSSCVAAEKSFSFSLSFLLDWKNSLDNMEGMFQRTYDMVCANVQCKMKRAVAL